MEGQLVTGQWVEILAGDPATATCLSGFVLSLRPTEMLITFPDLLELPAWLESGGEVRVRHASHFGQHSGLVRILRVAAGPPPSLVLERLTHVETEQRRRSVRHAACLPVSIRVVASKRKQQIGLQEARARTRNLSASGLLIETSLLLRVGEIVELTLAEVDPGLVLRPDRFAIRGKVVRVDALGTSPRRAQGAAVELVPDNEASRTKWAQFMLALQRNERA
jgi:Tfp pilus assembly protein PilZ